MGDHNPQVYDEEVAPLELVRQSPDYHGGTQRVRKECVPA